jgi:hypothetical protein
MTRTQHGIRRVALALPEAIEQPHFDRPSFRIRGKIFATLPGPQFEGDERVVLLRIPMVIKDALMVSDADAMVSLGPWEKQRIIQVAIGRMDWDKLEGLVKLAWREAAPKRWLKELGPGPWRE